MRLLMPIILLAGLISLVYYGIIILYAGVFSEFAWFWSLFGIGCIFLFFFFLHIKKFNLQIPHLIKISASILCLIGIVIFLITEALIIVYANKKPKNNADYMIVLGAKVRKTTITNSLKKRLDKAIEYKKENPQTKIIVSGGQGPGEDITEAEAMEEYLIEKGVSSSDIIKEDKSTNTNENIIFSKKIIEQRNRGEITKENILIVTNGFHLYRAVLIAKKQGIRNIQGAAAKTDKILCVNYYIREVFAIMKDRMVGNI